MKPKELTRSFPRTLTKEQVWREVRRQIKEYRETTGDKRKVSVTVIPDFDCPPVPYDLSKHIGWSVNYSFFGMRKVNKK